MGRMATYLQVYGDTLVEINQWDPTVLTRFRADKVVQGVAGAIDAVATWDELHQGIGAHPSALVPSGHRHR